MENQMHIINYISFNQDQSCFTVATDKGFSIYLTHPYCKAFSRDLDASIANIQILNKCNFMTILGKGLNPEFPDNKVILWDDQQHQCVGEMSFLTSVKNIIFRNQIIFVILEDMIFQYNLLDLSLQQKFETGENPLGLCAVHINDEILIIYPDEQEGSIRLNKNKKQMIIPAHKHELQILQLNDSGTLLATASVSGTIINIIEMETGNIIRQLRRGTTQVIIQSICFDKVDTYLCCSSNSGTIHIFKINDDQQNQNKQHYFSFMKSVIPYLGSEWSFTNVNLAEKQTLVSFCSELNMIIAISYEGNYYKIKFNEDGSECNIINKINIFQYES